jgi:ribosome-binding protein aMBF1 (putative translation factor)
VARQSRAELQQSRQHPRVITNDDLSSPATAPAPSRNASPETSSGTSSGTQAKDGEAAPSADASTDGAKKSVDSENKPQERAANSKASDGSSSDPKKEAEARELETEARTQKINQQYLDRIAAIRDKIGTAQKELARLQRDQVESTIQFQKSVGSSPSVMEYEQQQRLFNEQIDTQRNLIISLNLQLEDAQESARHAGVPHSSD